MPTLHDILYGVVGWLKLFWCYHYGIYTFLYHFKANAEFAKYPQQKRHFLETKVQINNGIEVKRLLLSCMQAMLR